MFTKLFPVLKSTACMWFELIFHVTVTNAPTLTHYLFLIVFQKYFLPIHCCHHSLVSMLTLAALMQCPCWTVAISGQLIVDLCFSLPVAKRLWPNCDVASIAECYHWCHHCQSIVVLKSLSIWPVQSRLHFTLLFPHPLPLPSLPVNCYL